MQRLEHQEGGVKAPLEFVVIRASHQMKWPTFPNLRQRVGIDQSSPPAGNDVKREMYAACLEDQAVFRPPHSSQALNSWPSSAFMAASSVRRCSMERMRP